MHPAAQNELLFTLERKVVGLMRGSMCIPSANIQNESPVVRDLTGQWQGSVTGAEGKEGRIALKIWNEGGALAAVMQNLDDWTDWHRVHSLTS